LLARSVPGGPEPRDTDATIFLPANSQNSNIAGLVLGMVIQDSMPLRVGGAIIGQERWW